MKREYITALMMIILVLFTLPGCRKKEVKEKKEEPAVPVMVYVVKPDTISQYLKLTGGIEAENEAMVYSKTSERIEKILVKIGEQVKRDQVLAIQSSQILQQGIKQAEAALRSATAQYELVKQEYERTERLFREKIISQQQLDQVKTQFEAAEANVEQAQSRLKQAQEQYETSEIKAPFAGKVAMIFFKEGQTAPVGQPVVKIVHTSAVKAKLYVPETDIAFISTGQRVIATFPAFPNVEFVGSVERIDEAIDPQKRALEIEVSIDNPQSMLKSGQFGQFLIETQQHTDTIVVTDTAVMTQTEVKLTGKGEQKAFQTYYVYVVEDGRARKRTVTPGIYAKGRIELTSGIKEGDSIIVVGQNIVKDGDQVNIVNTPENGEEDKE